MFENRKRNVGALIDVDHNQDGVSDYDNNNFAKASNGTKGLGYDYEGGDENVYMYMNMKLHSYIHHIHHSHHNHHRSNKCLR